MKNGMKTTVDLITKSDKGFFRSTLGEFESRAQARRFVSHQPKQTMQIVDAETGTVLATAWQ